MVLFGATIRTHNEKCTRLTVATFETRGGGGCYFLPAVSRYYMGAPMGYPLLYQMSHLTHSHDMLIYSYESQVHKRPNRGKSATAQEGAW